MSCRCCEKMAKTFIKTAIEISNDYELDIPIMGHLATFLYYFDCGAMQGWKEKRILRCRMTSPSLIHIKGFDMVMSLDFYTKAVFKRDRLIHPQWSDLSL